MNLPEDAVLLRIFVGESDKWQHRPLYEAIVIKARESHLAGATVLRASMDSAPPVECTPPKFCDCRWTCRL